MTRICVGVGLEFENLKKRVLNFCVVCPLMFDFEMLTGSFFDRILTTSFDDDLIFFVLHTAS